MVWVRIDDHLDEHPKIVPLSDGALSLWLAGLCYCNRNLTNGIIPTNVLRKLRPSQENSRVFADELVEAHLWTPTKTGWKIHDYLDYQFSKSKVLQIRQSNAKRVGNWRERHRNAVSNTVTPCNAVSNADPVPVPVLNTIADGSASATELPLKPANGKDHTIKLLLTFYDQTFSTIMHNRPVITGKDAAQAKLLLRDRSLDEAKSLVREFMENPPDFCSTKGLYGMEHIVKWANTVLSRGRDA